MFDPRDADHISITEAQHIALVAARLAAASVGIEAGLDRLKYIGGTGNNASQEPIFEIGMARHDSSAQWRSGEALNVVVSIKTRQEGDKKVFDSFEASFEYPEGARHTTRGKVGDPFVVNDSPTTAV